MARLARYGQKQGSSTVTPGLCTLELRLSLGFEKVISFIKVDVKAYSEWINFSTTNQGWLLSRSRATLLSRH